MTAPQTAERVRLTVISPGTSDPSSTRLLADRIASRATAPIGKPVVLAATPAAPRPPSTSTPTSCA